jgi:nucleoside-diphosphate-sugar epimerase
VTVVASALVGHTGFVGGTLLRQHRFDDLYNTSNIESLAGKSYDLIACAAAPGLKWKANQQPEADLASIRRLLAPFESVRAGSVVLLSTVDVYPRPIGVDESTPIDRGEGSAYGRHRLLLEDFLVERFDTTVVRLPGLFGEGLKKNVIFDLLHRHRVEQIVPNAVFQFFDLERLWTDVVRARDRGLELVNFATEPVSVRELADAAFGLKLAAADAPGAPRYDVRTRFGAAFGAEGDYLASKEQVLSSMRAFVERQGWARP